MGGAEGEVGVGLGRGFAGFFEGEGSVHFWGWSRREDGAVEGRLGLLAVAGGEAWFDEVHGCVAAIAVECEA